MRNAIFTKFAALTAIALGTFALAYTTVNAQAADKKPPAPPAQEKKDRERAPTQSGVDADALARLVAGIRLADSAHAKAVQQGLPPRPLQRTAAQQARLDFLASRVPVMPLRALADSFDLQRELAELKQKKAQAEAMLAAQERGKEERAQRRRELEEKLRKLDLLKDSQASSALQVGAGAATEEDAAEENEADEGTKDSDREDSVGDTGSDGAGKAEVETHTTEKPDADKDTTERGFVPRAEPETTPAPRSRVDWERDMEHKRQGAGRGRTAKTKSTSAATPPKKNKAKKEKTQSGSASRSAPAPVGRGNKGRKNKNKRQSQAASSPAGPTQVATSGSRSTGGALPRAGGAWDPAQKAAFQAKLLAKLAEQDAARAKARRAEQQDAPADAPIAREKVAAPVEVHAEQQDVSGWLDSEAMVFGGDDLDQPGAPQENLDEQAAPGPPTDEGDDEPGR